MYKMSAYKFVSNFDDDTTNNEPNVYFYQIASFADLKTKRYHCRRFTINYNNEFVNIKDRYISNRVLDKFLKIKKNNQYKLFPVYDLNYVDHPANTDILLLKSDLLATNYDYYGYAPIKN